MRDCLARQPTAHQLQVPHRVLLVTFNCCLITLPFSFHYPLIISLFFSSLNPPFALLLPSHSSQDHHSLLGRRTRCKVWSSSS